MWNITRYTLQQIQRQGYVQGLTLVIMLLYVLVSLQGVQNQQKRLEAYHKATQEMRQAWETQGAVNPHNSAHYGHIIFQPVTSVQLLDNGIRPYAGGMLRLEAHKQNTPGFSAVQQQTELSRFGDFSLAWVLHTLIPLLIFLVCFRLISTDAENKVLPLVAVQGTQPIAYLAGKWLAATLVAYGLLGSGLLIQGAVWGLSGLKASWETGFLLSWIVGYLLYYALLSAIGTGISAWLKNSGAALALLLGLWVCWMIVMPRMTANIGATLFPFEHKTTFDKTLAEDRQKGLDGHNPADDRIKQFEDSLLSHYGVSALNELPVNADGLIMQADENYSNLVYDKHMRRIEQTLHNQNKISRIAGFINPAITARQWSMAFAQSDDYHHIQLLQDAEQYRRKLIQTLNEKMAYGGSKTGDWEWAPDSTWYATLPDFYYKPPPLQNVWKTNALHLMAALWWILLLGAWYWWLGKKLYQF